MSHAREISGMLAVVLSVLLAGCGATPMKKGNQALSEHRPGVAIERYGETLQEAPSAEAYIGRGMALEQKGELREAWSDYNQAADMNPDSKWAHVHRGRVDLMLGRVADAEKDADRALELAPEFSRALGLQAQLLQEKDDVEAAADKYLEAAEKAESETYAARCLKNAALSHMQAGRYGEARAVYRRALNNAADMGDRTDHETLVLGVMNYGAGNQDRAVELFNQLDDDTRQKVTAVISGKNRASNNIQSQ